MSKTCENCGRPITVMIFRGGRWCSENCRKVLLGKMKCWYRDEWADQAGWVQVCQVHGHVSKYGSEKGRNRPCTAVEPYGF